MVLRRKRADDRQARGYGPDWNVPPRFNFTRDVIEAYAADPLRRALTFVDGEGIVDRRTFVEVAEDAARWAHFLRSRTDRGDRVVVQLGKTPAWLGALLGALKGGLVTIPCSEQLRAKDLAFRARDSGAALVVADRSCEKEIAGMVMELERPPQVVFLDDAREELRQHRTTAPTVDTAADDLAFILYTSGTTRNPKGVTHTHAYTWAARSQAEHWLDARSGDLVWCTAGTGWAKSIWNVLLGPWSLGAEIVLHEGGFDPAERLSLIEKLGVTVLCQAPTEYRLLVGSGVLDRAYVPALRHAVSAGEPLNPEVIDRFRESVGITVHDGYGQTENTLLVANLAGTDVRAGSMGLPTPGHDIAVIDESGHVCSAGEEGDIALLGRPPSLFTGYWQAPGETAAVFRDGWYVTGDRAVRDEDGYIWFTGRADDVILSAAYRIGPFEVESALLEHEAVLESAVVGKPHADRGEIVKAFVVLREGFAESVELVEELQAHVRSVTAPYKYPREIEFVTELPKTRSGKIRRVELRERERGLATQALSGAAEEKTSKAAARAPAMLAAEQVAENERAKAAQRAEYARRAEEARLIEEAQALEAERLAEEARHVDEARRAELARAAEEARLAEEARVAEEARLAESARLAEEQWRAEEIRRVDEARRAAEAQAAERERVLAERARAREERERERHAAETRRREQAEAERIARAKAREAADREAEVRRLQEEADAAAAALRREAERAAAEQRERAEQERIQAEEKARRAAAEREAIEAAAREAAAVAARELAQRDAAARELARREAAEGAAREAALLEAAARREAERERVVAAERAATDSVPAPDPPGGAIVEDETGRRARRGRGPTSERKRLVGEECERAKRIAEETKAQARTAAEETKRREAQAREDARREEREAKERARSEAQERKQQEAQAREDARREEREARERARREAEEETQREAKARDDARREEREAKERARSEAEARKQQETHAREEAKRREHEEIERARLEAEARKRRAAEAREAVKRREREDG
ncbi:MAG: AMP-binding protein, partial [Gaiella sp.]